MVTTFAPTPAQMAAYGRVRQNPAFMDRYGLYFNDVRTPDAYFQTLNDQQRNDLIRVFDPMFGQDYRRVQNPILDNMARDAMIAQRTAEFEQPLAPVLEAHRAANPARPAGQPPAILTSDFVQNAPAQQQSAPATGLLGTIMNLANPATSQDAGLAIGQAVREQRETPTMTNVVNYLQDTSAEQARKKAEMDRRIVQPVNMSGVLDYVAKNDPERPQGLLANLAAAMTPSPAVRQMQDEIRNNDPIFGSEKFQELRGSALLPEPTLQDRIDAAKEYVAQNNIPTYFEPQSAAQTPIAQTFDEPPQPEPALLAGTTPPPVAETPVRNADSITGYTEEPAATAETTAPPAEQAPAAEQTQPPAQQTQPPAQQSSVEDQARARSSSALNPESVYAGGGQRTGNARGSRMPDLTVNRNEALIRLGLAMMGGSGQGFSGAMAATNETFTDIQNQNRQAQEQAFAVEEQRRRDQAARAFDLMKAERSGAAASSVEQRKRNESMESLRQTRDKMQQSLQYYDQLVEQGLDPLSYWGKGGDWTLGQLSRLGLSNEERDARVALVGQFESVTNDFLNQYVKSITGAAMTNAEVERIKGAMPNIQNSPARFRGQMKVVMSNINASILRMEALARGEITYEENADGSAYGYFYANGQAATLKDFGGTIAGDEDDDSSTESQADAAYQLTQ